MTTTSTESSTTASGLGKNEGWPRGATKSVLASLAAASLSLAACSSPATSGSGPIDPGLAALISEAKAGGASEAQLATLRSYVPGSPVPFDVLRAAYDRTFACLDNAGVPYGEVSTYVDGAGYSRITYGIYEAPGLTDEQTQRIAAECQFGESIYVDQLYIEQPGYVEAADRAFAAARPSILACLRDNGVDIDDDATRSELVSATFTLAASAQGDNGLALGPDCTSLLPDIGY